MRASQLVACCVLLGCAGPLANVNRAGFPAPATEMGWRVLTEGRVDEAVSAFDRQLSADGHDVLARFGRATIAFDRGDSVRALAEYARVVAAVADGKVDAGPWTSVVSVAAGRLLGLLEEVSEERRRAVEDQMLALPRHRLPWPARLDLARLGDRAARRRDDPALLERISAQMGCARAVYHGGNGGHLPHLDLDGATAGKPAPADQRWTPLAGVGCRLSVPSRENRSGVQILRASIVVPEKAGAGDADRNARYQIVLDYGGQAVWSVDGGERQRHGSEVAYGPRAAATRVTLGPGRHDIDVRLAAVGSSTEFGLLVLPDDGERPVSFVEPRPVPASDAPRTTAVAGAATPARVPAVEVPGRDVPAAQPWAAVLDYSAAYVADRVGEVDQSLSVGARLAALPRFVGGLMLAAAIERNDVTRPASFARDGARALLRRAVALDSGVARAWQALAAIELEDEHYREATSDARQAAVAAPSWWAPELILASALRARGLEWDADRALEKSAQKAGPARSAPCAVVDALLRRAEERRDLPAEEALTGELGRCEPESDALGHRLRVRGDLAGALKILRRMATLAPERDDLRADIGELLLSSSQPDDRREGLRQLQAIVARAPRDIGARIRLADAEAAAGDLAAARKVIAEGMALRPDLPEVRRAARALELPLPLDDHRVDGKAAIRAFEKSGGRYAAPAVVVLDRTVARVFPDGASMILTHNIVRVLTKDAIDRWGEVSVGSGAEILLLRTHKPDGSTREPEEIAGKEAISAADLAIGDYIEWETLETKLAPDAFPGGFLGDRFYFRSFDAPLERSEYILITPAGMPLEVDRRAGAPVMERSAGRDGTAIARFVASRVPQLFAERSSVPAIEYVPSVRVSSNVSWLGWARFVREQLHGTTRSSPALRQLGATISETAKAKPGDHARLAAAIVAWVTANIEAADDLRDPASYALARGRGNRLALTLALARELGVSAQSVLVRSRLTADGDTKGAPQPQDLDDFADTLVRFDVGSAARARPVYVDLRLRHAGFGYLPPNLDGARTLALSDGRFAVATSTGSSDQRTIDMTIRLDEEGGGTARATEELTGWPALEWAELMDRLGSDRAKLHQDFEQRWLGVHFPGARLKELKIELPTEGQRAVRVLYSFFSPRMGVVNGQDLNARELKVSPTFFRSQPGRRFAAEPQRSTTLMLGFDVPFRLTANVELPRAAKLIEPAPPGGVVTRKGGYRFVEERFVRQGTPDVLVLRRDSALPIMRVSPEEYAGVAADLRRVDGLEQQEIRIRLRAGAGATRGAAGTPR